MSLDELATLDHAFNLQSNLEGARLDDRRPGLMFTRTRTRERLRRTNAHVTIARQSSRIVGGGQIRLSNGDVLAFGGGPTF